MVLELLKKAEILTERDDAGRAVTFNNLACYYRRQGKLHAALSHLQKALKIEARLSNVENPADTHLNMCAVLSQVRCYNSFFIVILIVLLMSSMGTLCLLWLGRWNEDVHPSFPPLQG